MTEKAKTESEVRATEVQRLDNIIEYLKAVRDAYKEGAVHYHSGALFISDETDVVEHTKAGEAMFKRPWKRSWRIHGDLVFGTEKKE